MSKPAARTSSLESAFANSSNHPPCTDRIIEQGNEKVKRLLPHFSMETISSSGHDKVKDLNLKDEVDIKLSGKKYTQTLPLLSRLKHRSTLPMVDVSGLKEDSCPSDEQSRHQLSFPVCFSEATSSCHAKFSEDQNILATQNRSQHLRQYSDHLSLSLGLCSSNHSFDDLSEFGSPFSAIDTQNPLPEEYDNKLTASKRLKATEALTSQLTIFYAGKVHIHHDVPEDKAKAIMLLAENATRQENPKFATQNLGCISSTIFQHCPSSSAHAPDTTLPQTSHDAGRSSASVGLSIKALSKLQPAGNIPYSALPQHRRLSLQRFLQKRTERARAVASPYIANKNNVESGSTLPRSRPSSPVLLNGTGSRASSPAVFLGGSACRAS